MVHFMLRDETPTVPIQSQRFQRRARQLLTCRKLSRNLVWNIERDLHCCLKVSIAWAFQTEKAPESRHLSAEDHGWVISVRRTCIIVRIVRSSILDPLLTPTKQALLAATILQPDKKWYFRELARQVHLQPSSIQRDLAALTEAGFLERHQDGNRVYYQGRRACPIFPELQQIL